METKHLIVDREEARELWRKYKSHQHYSAPIDREIQRTYQLIAQGRVVIRALESIKEAGLNTQMLPNLAIVRADAAECWLRLATDGSARFSDLNEWSDDRATRHHIHFPAGTFPGVKKSRGRSDAAKALVPIIPIHLRPRRGLANYHILFEAEWERVVPRDPYLLRRIGKGDMWLVVAAWDLTEIERAALATRLTS